MAPGAIARFAAPPRRRRLQRETRLERLARVAGRHGVGTALLFLFLAAAGVAGSLHGGEYERFVAENGPVGDVVARKLGFGIEAITITGPRELQESEILATAGIGPRSSLLFLDVATAREKLAEIPLVREASIRKMFPNRLIIEIAEREPYAIWQSGGVLRLVAADGAPISEMHDGRFADLPFVVGAGANKRVGEFTRLVAAIGDVRARVRAGVFVGQRRWNLVMSSGLEVKLPEAGSEVAAATFGKLAREQHLLDKDIISIDFRSPGRVYARLSDQAAAARAETLAKGKKRGPA